MVTLGRGTRALVGGYSQHLYGAINQSEAVFCALEKRGGGGGEHRKRADKRRRGGMGVLLVA